MKSEHRHELETNELSATLARGIEKIKPFSGQIITGIVLLSVLYVGATLWEVQAANREREAWNAYALATDTRDPELKSLQRVAGDEQYDGTAMQEWAYVNWSDRQVIRAMNSYFINRETTAELLKNASGIYQELSRNAADPQVLNRARFGLARVYEMQNKIDDASRQYLTVRGELQPQASERAKRLESTAVREACNWLATAELPQRDLTGGQGATGTRPEFDAALPSGESSSNDSINPGSLEDLLKEFGEDSSSENRYGEQDEPPAESSEEATTTEGDSSADDSEEATVEEATQE